MEADKNPFPRMEIFNPLDKIARAASWIADHFYPMEEVPTTGAEAMLSEQLELEY